MTFAAVVPNGRYVLVGDDEVLRCTSDYQRSGFTSFSPNYLLARASTSGSRMRFAEQ